MNIYDVSKQAGVSIATVSRVLNGNPNVKEQTRTKVLAVMDELGYTPNVFARGLGLNTMKTVGIMSCDSLDSYLSNPVYCLEHQLRSHGYDSLLCCTGSLLKDKRTCFELLLSKRVDAAILVGSKFVELEYADNSYLMEASKKLPIMLVNGYLDAPGIYSTICNSQEAIYHAATLLLHSGRKRILYLYTSHSCSGLNKIQGYKDALSGFGLPVCEELIHQCTRNLEAAKHLIEKLTDLGLEFDAILTSDDSLAVGAVKYAHSRHIAIPKELAVIGYHNSILSRCTDPEISSIDTKVKELCTCTVNTLMSIFHGDKVPTKTTITADFIQRQTTDFSLLKG